MRSCQPLVGTSPAAKLVAVPDCRVPAADCQEGGALLQILGPPFAPVLQAMTANGQPGGLPGGGLPGAGQPGAPLPAPGGQGMPPGGPGGGPSAPPGPAGASAPPPPPSLHPGVAVHRASLAAARALVAAAIARLTKAGRLPTVCGLQAAIREHDGVELTFRQIIEARAPLRDAPMAGPPHPTGSGRAARRGQGRP